MKEKDEPADAASQPSVVSLSCGSSHTCALLDCDVVASWGRGEDGQLGHGDAQQLNTPKAVHALLDAAVSGVVCGAEYTVALSRAHRTVYSWGWGDFGRLGHGSCSDVFVPTPIAFFNGLPVAQVACGDTHTLVCTDGGELYTFGRNQNGQLGHGSTNDLLAPARVEALQGKVVTSVAAGAEHSVAATQDGQAWSWGWGRYGNLGSGERLDRTTPGLVAALEGAAVSSVACGWRHSAVVTADGRLFTFGWSKYGQLGLGDNEDRLVPAEVAALSGRAVVQIAGGWRHTMALDGEGRLWGWGWNKFGQLGLGHERDVAAPVLVEALASQPVRLMACGWRHTVAVCTNGQVYSWGRGVNGQLGLGSEADEASPCRLTTLCRGTASRASLAATATGGGGGTLAPADRFGVVPLPGGDDASGAPASVDHAAAAAVVPGAVPDAGEQQQQQLGEAAAAAAAKRPRLGESGGGADDAAVPGS